MFSDVYKKLKTNHFLDYIDYRQKNKTTAIAYWICAAGALLVEIYGLIMFLTAGYADELAMSKPEFAWMYLVLPLIINVGIGGLSTACYFLLNKTHPVVAAYLEIFFLTLLITVVISVHMLSTIFAGWSVVIVFTLMYKDKFLTTATAVASLACYIFIVVFRMSDSGWFGITHDVIEVSANIIVLALTWFAVTKSLDTFDELIGQIVSSELDKTALEQKVQRDSLTNLYNHAAFYAHLGDAIYHYKTNGEPLSIVVFDIDNFKKINDSYGHALGDKVILGLSKILQNYDEEEVQAYRYGGEEFAMIVKSGTGRAAKLANDARARFHALPYFEKDRPDDPLYFTVSGGVSEWKPGYGGKREFFATADDALYAAKRSGKNRVCRA